MILSHPSVGHIFSWMLPVTFLLLSHPAQALAGEYNEVLSIGDKAPVWTDLPGIDDKKSSLADLADKEVIVVAFTCNSCSYAVEYEDRLNRFAKEFNRKDSPVAVVAINVNKIADDSLPAMKKRAEEKSFAFPYLFDETQKIAKEYGANRTPEFFVLDKERKVVYMGAMDDSTDPSKVTKRYVEEAVQAALRRENPKTSETPPIGCRIRWDNKRR